MTKRPKLGVFKFASCDGCQLALLDAEDHLLAVAEAVDIAYFLEVSSRVVGGPYDIVLVEGSITTPTDAQRILEVRRQARYLITIGACATAGGIQSLRNWADCDEFMSAVYATPAYIQVLDQSTPIADHVPVDFELRGCPINQYQLIEVIQSLLAGRRPRTPTHSVCLDCKRNGTVCVMVAQNQSCLGPVTQAGCGAICPQYNRGCYGCYGPAGQANLSGLTSQLVSLGMPPQQVVTTLRGFNGYAEDFRRESNRLEAEYETETEADDDGSADSSGG